MKAWRGKLVDDKGVVNYSNKPPAGVRAKAQVVEERLSISSDPALRASRAVLGAQEARRSELAAAEWLQRQRLMLATQAATPYSPCPYRVDCGARTLAPHHHALRSAPMRMHRL